MSATPIIRSIREMSIHGKRVLIRVDFNVPMENGKVIDDSRIREALPTIQYAIEKGARVILCSHLGRPDGQRKREFSMEPVASHLAGLLSAEVTLADDCVGEGIELMAQSLKNGQVLVLENLRFHKEEEANDPAFAAALARLADIYVNDAFGTAHRKHASTYGVPSVMSEKGMGLLVEKELKYLHPLVSNPAKPFWAILGGSKVSDKIQTVTALLPSLNGICVGGAMAHAFWAVQGTAIPSGAKQPKPEDVDAARMILREAGRREIPVHVPKDTIGGFDIGPRTLELFAGALKTAKTIFWNGPLGWFEKPEYARGTFDLAKAVSEMTAVKIVGGGDTVSAIHASGFSEKFDHLSTGGGAVLEFIEHGSLPGIEILKRTPRPETTQKITRERIG